jgi:hypothetical protein
MRTFARFVMPFAAAIGLAVAFGPAAGATTTGFGARPITHVVNFPTTFSLTSPCDGDAVDTTGHGTVITTTLGQQTTITIVDRESGDGYQLVTQGEARFDALASEYSVPARSLWVNRDLGLDFHASFAFTVTVNSENAATDFSVQGVQGTCGVI